MIARLGLVAALCLAALSVTAEVARVVYVGVEDDPWYAPQPSYTGLSLRDRQRPIEAAELAMREARVLSRALGIDFVLETQLVEPGTGAEAVRAALEKGALGVLLDLPAAEMAQLSLPENAGAALNIRHSDDALRGAGCVPGLLHTLPSQAMLADALSQLLAARGWRRVLLLHGGTEADAAEAASVRASLAKFGLVLAGDEGFALTNDPRQRDASNIALLTGQGRYDVVWLVDNDGEFGRYVPYSTYAARPVVGAEGLRPVAWHWTYERHGAPQLNQRFRRQAGRDMTSLDWAAWVAVRAVIEAVQRTGSAGAAEVAGYLHSVSLSLDLYKGAPGSFRPWSGQLRQPILLATHNAVIERAPLDGFEHRTDTLDTLGLDRPEARCAP